MRVRRRKISAAVRYRPNAFYEAILAQARQGKIDLALLSGPTRLALNAYMQAQREHELLSRIGARKP